MTLFAFLVDFITGGLYVDEIGFLDAFYSLCVSLYVSNDFGSIICRVT